MNITNEIPQNNFECWGIHGQKSLLRPVNPLMDLDSLLEIEAHGNGEYVYGKEPRSPEEVLKWLKLAQTNNLHILFGVCDPSSPNDLSGWILAEQVGSQMIVAENGFPNYHDMAFELTAIRKQSSPKGLMASGIRQACFALMLYNTQLVGSDSKLSFPSIYAVIHQTNERSIQMVERVGFERKNKHVNFLGTVDENRDFYLLNWEKWNERVFESADPELLKVLGVSPNELIRRNRKYKGNILQKLAYRTALKGGTFSGFKRNAIKRGISTAYAHSMVKGKMGCVDVVKDEHDIARLAFIEPNFPLAVQQYKEKSTDGSPLPLPCAKCRYSNYSDSHIGCPLII